MALLRQFLTSDVPCACGDNDSGDNAVWRLRGPPIVCKRVTVVLRRLQFQTLLPALPRTRSPCTQVSPQPGDPGFTSGCPGAELSAGAPWGEQESASALSSANTQFKARIGAFSHSPVKGGHGDRALGRKGQTRVYCSSRIIQDKLPMV